MSSVSTELCFRGFDSSTPYAAVAESPTNSILSFFGSVGEMLPSTSVESFDKPTVATRHSEAFKICTTPVFS